MKKMNLLNRNWTEPDFDPGLTQPNLRAYTSKPGLTRSNLGIPDLVCHENVSQIMNIC